MSNSNTSHPIGSIINKRYVIQAYIAEGGQAIVYRGFDQNLRRVVAIKEFKTDAIPPAELATAINAFEQTAYLFAQINHVGLAATYDYFTENNVPYLVTEFVEGPTLAAVQANYPSGVPESMVIEWAKQLCDVLHFLHTQHPPIIFRDLKPENIMLLPNGQVKLIDFGIARTFKTGKRADTDRFGTPGYAAPEQYGNEQTRPASDVYALGATLFHLITGVSPSNLANPMQLPRADTQNPRISQHLANIIATATQPIIADRFQTTMAMKQALSTIHNATLLMPSNLRSDQGLTLYIALFIFILFGGCFTITIFTCTTFDICRQLTLTNVVGSTPVAFSTQTPSNIARNITITPMPTAASLLISSTSTQLPTSTFIPPTTTPPSLQSATAIAKTKIPDIQTRVFNVRSCMSECQNDGRNAIKQAPRQSIKIYTSWEFENIPIGSSYIRRWIYNGKEWARYVCTWAGPNSGEDTITLTDPAGLGSGLWEMIITVDGAELARHRLEILGNWTNNSIAGQFNTCYGKR